MTPLEILQTKLGYSFQNQSLLQLALTHRSFGVPNNERLEFLGDGVLNCVAAQLLFEQFKHHDEGQLSRIRSYLVRQESLVLIAQQLPLVNCIRLGQGERKASSVKDSIMADCVEAIVGAMYLDSSFEVAKAWVVKQLMPLLEGQPLQHFGKDAKTRLQEWLQAKRVALPTYQVLVEGGTDASPEFTVECSVGNMALPTLGVARSRRAAEQLAAEHMLQQLEC